MSLLSEIFEQLEFERLIEEGKDPVELLHYKFQHIPADVIDAVIAIDPTKKKSYSQWLLSKWDNEKDTILEGLKNGRIEKLFQHYKEHQDIQIKDCPSVAEGLRAFVPEEDTVLTKSSNPMTYLENLGKEVPSELANDFDIVFNDEDWIIAVPNTYEAECKLGENMAWCTANHFGNGRSYYDNYLSKGGKYYVNFDLSQGESAKGKDYPFKRYQFHFESHQFMDKNDDPVSLGDIGIPDEAIQYYESEGYDSSDFEDEEAKMERYDQDRWECSYRLNGDLLLNIAYDDNYEFTEPDENTDYYIFDENDDRDPISWDEVPNPNFHDDVVIKNNENGNYIILRSKYGDNSVLCAVKESTRHGWRDWNVYKMKNYIELPNDIGIFGVDDDGVFSLVSVYGKTDSKIKTSECDNIFINEYCTKADAENWGMIFVETISNGYHSLFAISPSTNGMGDDCEVIVPRDIPANGECFMINQRGLVEGELRSYRVYDSDYYGEEDMSAQWNMEQKLANGDYLVSIEEMDGYGRTKQKFNILKGNTKQPLIEDWFDKYKGCTPNLYGFTTDKKIGFFSVSNGQQVGRWYDDFDSIDSTQDVIAGIIGEKNNIKETDIINGYANKVVASFQLVISRKAINNKIIVQDFDGFTSKVFDYMECKFYFPELSMFRRINQYEHPYIFACDINGTEEKALFDLSTQQVLVRGIKGFSRLSRFDTNYVKLTKLNDKVNMFDMKGKSEMLQSDVDEITSMNQYVNILVYRFGKKYYPLNYKTKQIQINPNGIGVATYVSDSGDKICCEGENYNIYFSPENNGQSYKFYSWQNKTKYGDYGTNFDREHTPQEVLNMYNLIFGQQEAITKNFKQLVNRMNEAMKLSYNDILD